MKNWATHSAGLLVWVPTSSESKSTPSKVRTSTSGMTTSFLNQSVHPPFPPSINSQPAWKRKPLTGERKSTSACALSHTRQTENKVERKKRRPPRGGVIINFLTTWVSCFLWCVLGSLMEIFQSPQRGEEYYCNSEPVNILVLGSTLGTVSSPALVFINLYLSKIPFPSSPWSKRGTKPSFPAEGATGLSLNSFLGLYL